MTLQRRTEDNIGMSNHTSVKVHAPPGGGSNWNMGWGDENPANV